MSGRPVIHITPVLAAATGRVRADLAAGASAALIVAFGNGTGELPTASEAQVVYVDAPQADSVMDEVAGLQRCVHGPDPVVRSAVERFDPDGRALVQLSFPVRTDGFLGRETIGGRNAVDYRLEDKTRSQEVWSGAGIPHCTEEVVDVARDALRDSAVRLDLGLGTVWSADASQGMNGGGDRVWWVRDAGDDQLVRQVVDELSRHAARARVMPFLDGIPCSGHGIVLDDGVVVLRPVELAVLRTPGSPKFRSGGIGTSWDPTPADREQLRTSVRLVGRHLKAAHGYRGGFGVDGVLTRDGWAPNELNPRFSAGLSTLAKAMPEVPLADLERLVRAGHQPAGIPAAELEQLLLARLDQRRFAAAYTSTSRVRPTTTTEVAVAGDATSLRRAGRTDDVIGTLELGPATMGGLVRFTPNVLPPGTRIAPYAVAAFRLADRLWHTGIGEVRAAPDVRPR